MEKATKIFEKHWTKATGKTLDETTKHHMKYAIEAINEALLLGNISETNDQLKLSDFKIGFEYEEYQIDSKKYLNRGMIWVKKVYGLNSPRLHKIKKLINEGKLRKI